MAEERNSNADFDAYNGDGFLQMYDQQQQFDLGSELERGNVDSTGSEMKHSTSHFDSSSSGLVFMVLLSLCFQEEQSSFIWFFCKYMRNFLRIGFESN